MFTQIQVERHQQSIKPPGTSTIYKENKIHQAWPSPSDTSVPKRYLGRWDFSILCVWLSCFGSIWRPFEGPKPPDFAMRFAEPSRFEGFFAGHRKTQRKNNSTKTHDNYWKTTFHLLSVFSYVVFPKIPIILFYQLFGKQKTPGSPGIYMTLRISSPPMEVCPVWFNSQVDQNKWTKSAFQNNFQTQFIEKTDFQKWTNNSISDCNLPCFICLVTCLDMYWCLLFPASSKNKLRELELWFCDEVASSLLHDLLLGMALMTNQDGWPTVSSC